MLGGCRVSRQRGKSGPSSPVAMALLGSRSPVALHSTTVARSRLQARAQSRLPFEPCCAPRPLPSPPHAPRPPARRGRRSGGGSSGSRMPSVTALRRWLVFVALLRLFSGRWCGGNAAGTAAGLQRRGRLRRRPPPPAYCCYSPPPPACPQSAWAMRRRTASRPTCTPSSRKGVRGGAGWSSVVLHGAAQGALAAALGALRLMAASSRPLLLLQSRI